MSPISIYGQRQAQLSHALRAARLDALVLNPGPSLVYLTGIGFHLMERPVVAIFIPNTPVCFIIPQLEEAKMQGLSFATQHFLFGEDSNTWGSTYTAGMHAAGLEYGRIGVEAERLRLLELRYLQAGSPAVDFIPIDASLIGLRAIKDAEEITATRKAVEIAQDALAATLPSLKIGVTEREIASELTLQMFRHGCDPELPFGLDVTFGENTANPHAIPGSRTLKNGDLILFDWGACYDGYCSDITRVFSMGKPDAEFVHIAEIVKQANSAARALAAPGILANELDNAARSQIENAGYGQLFRHRTGHGLGMEVHEAPYIVFNNNKPLNAGNIFTIEPGIYLLGRGGIRIEDDVLITENGAETLSSLPRELIEL